ncbi:MAG: transposase [Candidatus Moranbacteria bacterium]|nr:transposase [Candidatus Moranbacteria bacterium]
MRKVPFVEHEYYHIYNRGVDKRNVFLEERDYRRFLLAMDLLNDEKDGLMRRWRDFKENHPEKPVKDFLAISVGGRNHLVDIVAYCLNSNHYHFILKQTGDNNGIKIFMQRLGNSYTKYFNEKHKRSGSLFQGSFKATHIEPNNFLRMSVYVNCNSEIHKIHPARNYKWCSFPEYLGKESNQLCKKEVILSQFKNSQEYLEYAVENIADFRERKQDEKLWLE